MSQENAERMRRAFAAFERGDKETWRELFHPDIEVVPIGDRPDMWQEKGDYLADKGDQAGTDAAYDAASTVAGEMNAAGCTIFLVDD